MQNHLKDEQYAFIKYLTNLTPEADRGTLAVLRRGAAGNPADDLNSYRFVSRKIPDYDRGTQREAVYYLVASLYALNPRQSTEGNLGTHMKQAAGMRQDSEAAERRFTVLLTSRQEDLVKPLRQAMTMLKQLELPVNWFGLFSDLLYWNSPQKSVQRAWANHFWAYEPADPEKPQNQLLSE